jgi:DNA-binding LacI/PurR family transcriptional regulator
MKSRRFSTVTDQVVETLREGMAGGRWRETLPGRERLARELGVNHKTVEAAVRRLVDEGWLVAQGGTRRRKIVVLEKGRAKSRDLRVRILAYDRESMRSPWNAALLGELQKLGFKANFALKTLMELGMEVGQVKRFVLQTDADAWIVNSGSREVLEWFAQQDTPALAMFGRFLDLPIAATGPRMIPALKSAVARLVALGHTRIVMLAHAERRLPKPGLFQQTFLQELQHHGIPVGPYNLPDWEDTPEGFQSGLDRLFHLTPPTALLLDEPRLFHAALLYLAARGIRIPHEVSLISTDHDTNWSWCQPEPTCLRWQPERVVKHAVSWVKATSKGKVDKRQVLFDGECTNGGTIAPAPTQNAIAH